jgi:catechol 2,3-dioxygenase-like lactoylglutathione lyase family enzyme
MLDHISLRVQDLPRALAFYKAALEPIGYKVMMEFPGVVGMGDGKPDLWISETDRPINPTHVSFTSDRASVDAFYAAALAAGGIDNGPPGLRADYHPFYYAAFALDPDGNNIEVVCHDDPNAPKAAAAARKPSATRRASKRPAPKAKAKVKAKPKAKPKAKAKAKAKKRR